MKRIEYFLDFQKLEELTNSSYWFDERDKDNFKYEFLKQTYLNKPYKKYKYPVTLYLGNKKFNIKFDLEDILEMIKNGATNVETEYYSIQFKKSENNPVKQQFLNNFKAFTPCGVFYSRRKRIDIKQLNGMIFLECNSDNITLEQIQVIKSEPYTYAFFRQLEKDKFAILVRTSGMTSRNYEQYQYQLKEYYRKLIGSDAISASYINRSIYLSHDKELYLNLLSFLFKI